MQLLQLLGVRRTELAQAIWDEINFDKALWVIPAERMKSDEGFAVPLSPRAVEILRSLPRFEGSSYVFTICGNRPLDDFGRVKEQINKQISGPIAHWTFHDLRRTFRTGLSTLGIAPHIAELCIAHTQPGLMRTYDLYKFLDEKRHALDTWAAYLLSIVEPQPNKVVPIRVAAAS